MEMRREFIPFMVSLLGVLTDFITTRIGLNLGFYEAHPYYHPVTALLIIWSAVLVLVLTLPKRGVWYVGIMGIASAPFIGTVNNILVISQTFL